MRFVLGEHATHEEVESSADRHLFRAAWLAETRFHPERATHQDVVGEENLKAALRAGSGCVLTFVHHGDYVASFGSLARRGFSICVLADSNIFKHTAKAWLKQTRRIIDHVPGSHAIDVASGSSAIRESLKRGECVVVALDPPGSTPYSFLGKNLLMSSGGVRTAFEVGCPVVVMSAAKNPIHADGPSDVVLSPPLNPQDFDSPETLMAELALRLEESIRAWPEALAWEGWDLRFANGAGAKDGALNRASVRHAEDESPGGAPRNAAQPRDSSL